MNKIYRILLSLVVVLFLASCGGGGGGGTTWGIDNTTYTTRDCPTCTGTTTNMVSATQVFSNEIIEPTDANTVLRIFHYQDQTKYACVVQGAAIIKKEN